MNKIFYSVAVISGLLLSCSKDLPLEDKVKEHLTILQSLPPSELLQAPTVKPDSNALIINWKRPADNFYKYVKIIYKTTIEGAQIIDTAIVDKKTDYAKLSDLDPDFPYVLSAQIFSESDIAGKLWELGTLKPLARPLLPMGKLFRKFEFQQVSNSILIADAVGVIDTTNHTVKIATMTDGSLGTLIPSFELNGEKTFLKVGEVRQESGVTPQNFASPVNYNLVRRDRTKQVYTISVSNFSMPDNFFYIARNTSFNVSLSDMNAVDGPSYILTAKGGSPTVSSSNIKTATIRQVLTFKYKSDVIQKLKIDIDETDGAANTIMYDLSASSTWVTYSFDLGKLIDRTANKNWGAKGSHFTLSFPSASVGDVVEMRYIQLRDRNADELAKKADEENPDIVRLVFPATLDWTSIVEKFSISSAPFTYGAFDEYHIVNGTWICAEPLTTAISKQHNKLTITYKTATDLAISMGYDIWGAVGPNWGSWAHHYPLIATAGQWVTTTIDIAQEDLDAAYGSPGSGNIGTTMRFYCNWPIATIDVTNINFHK